MEKIIDLTLVGKRKNTVKKMGEKLTSRDHSIPPSVGTLGTTTVIFHLFVLGKV
jgi:hypothetical protein